MPCGDIITPAGVTIPQPVVTSVTTSGCGPSIFTAKVMAPVNTDCTSTLATGLDAPTFYIYHDSNGNGVADDAGQNWTAIGQGTFSATNPGLWTLSYDTSALDRGQYLVGIRAKDTDASTHITWSFLTQNQVNAGTGSSPTPWKTGDYANPIPEPGVVIDTFYNSCGKYASLTKGVSPAYTTAGSNVTFTITVNNQTSAAFNVSSITDTLPPGFSYQSAPAEGGTLTGIVTPPANNSAGTVTWTFSGASVPAASSRTFTFTARVSSVAGTYSNSASAATTSAAWVTLNSNAVNIGVGAPQLTISKTPGSYQAVPGDTITYSIKYSNDSPVNTTSVIITDVLPAGLNFVAASNNGTYNAATRTVTWQPGSLASGEGPYTLTFQVTVDQNANPRTENTATISSSETTPASAKTVIYVPSPLEISKSANKTLVDPQGASPANQVIYTISYRNTGTTALTGATITDVVPAGFTYVSNTGSGTYTSGTVTWNIGTLNAGANGSVTVTMQVVNPYPVTAPNPFINTAVIDTNETGAFQSRASVLSVNTTAAGQGISTIFTISMPQACPIRVWGAHPICTRTRPPR